MSTEGILLVDDEEAVRRVVVQMLIPEGRAITEAATCAEARAEFDSGRHSLVITDICLPDGNGFDVIKYVKSVSPETKIIVMTGQDPSGAAVEGARLGVEHFLCKPFQAQELLEAIRSANLASNESARVEVKESRPGWYEFVITSSEDSLLRLQSFLDGELRGAVSESRFWELRTAISEMGRNAIEWGNAYDVSRVVMISMGITGEGVTVKIEDQGEGFEVARVLKPDSIEDPDALEEERIASGKRPGGFGFAMIGEMADRMIFNEKGNMVILHFAGEKDEIA